MASRRASRRRKAEAWSNVERGAIAASGRRPARVNTRDMFDVGEGAGQRPPAAHDRKERFREAFPARA